MFKLVELALGIALIANCFLYPEARAMVTNDILALSSDQSTVAQKIVDNAFLSIFSSPVADKICAVGRDVPSLIHYLGISPEAASIINQRFCAGKLTTSDLKVSKYVPRKIYHFIDNSDKKFKLHSWTDELNHSYIFYDQSTSEQDLILYLFHELVVSYSSKGRHKFGFGKSFFVRTSQRSIPLNRLGQFESSHPFWNSVPILELKPGYLLFDRITFLHELLGDLSVDFAFAALRAFDFERLLIGEEPVYSRDPKMCQEAFLFLVEHNDAFYQDERKMDAELRMDRMQEYDQFKIRYDYLSTKADRTIGEESWYNYAKEFIFVENGRKLWSYSDALKVDLAIHYKTQNILRNNDRQQLLITLSHPKLLLPFNNPISFCQYFAEAEFADLELEYYSNQGPRPGFSGGAYAPSMPDFGEVKTGSMSEPKYLAKSLAETKGIREELRPLKFNYTNLIFNNK